MQLDASERLLRLDLKGAAERDVPRVILHCCLQEKAWNPYYALVCVRVAAASKSHRTTLQFMVWDKLKALQELNARQSLNFGRFLACMLTSQVCARPTTRRLLLSVSCWMPKRACPKLRFPDWTDAPTCIAAYIAQTGLVAVQVLPMSTLKVVEFGSLDGLHLVFWRLFTRHFLLEFKTVKEMQEVLSRTSGKSTLQHDFRRFLKTEVGPWVASGKAGAAGLGQAEHDLLLQRTRHAERCLDTAGR
jgi:MA3 domain